MLNNGLRSFAQQHGAVLRRGYKKTIEQLHKQNPSVSVKTIPSRFAEVTPGAASIEPIAWSGWACIFSWASVPSRLSRIALTFATRCTTPRSSQ